MKFDTRREPVFVRKGGQPETRAQARPAPEGNADFWKELIGQEIVLQARGGTLYTGRLARYGKGLLRLEGVTIQGTNKTVRVPWTWVDRGAVQHLHGPVEAEYQGIAAEGGRRIGKG